MLLQRPPARPQAVLLQRSLTLHCALRPTGRCAAHARPALSGPLGLRSSGRARPALVCRAEQREPQQPAPAQGEGGSLLGTAGLFLLWAGLIAYAFFVAPNQTPLRDQYFIEKLVGLGVDDGVKINAVFTQLFFIMGIWPLVYTALLIPAARSGNGVPAWPFVVLSYGVGAFGLLPFMALWTPPKQPLALPPAPEDLEGTRNLMARGMESPVVAALTLGGALFCIYSAATAGIPAWNEYFKLLEESRFVHVTTLDFLTLTALAPFWMWNDASLRKWGPRDALLPVLSVLPVVGPALYLLLRPRTGGASADQQL